MSDETIVRALGQVEGKLDGLSGHVDRLATQTELTREALEEQGKFLAALPCPRHRREISNLHKAVGVAQENTGQIAMAEIKRKHFWKKVRRGLGYLGAFLAAALAVTGLLTWLNGR